MLCLRTTAAEKQSTSPLPPETSLSAYPETGIGKLAMKDGMGGTVPPLHSLRDPSREDGASHSFPLSIAVSGSVLHTMGPDKCFMSVHQGGFSQAVGLSLQEPPLICSRQAEARAFTASAANPRRLPASFAGAWSWEEARACLVKLDRSSQGRTDCAEQGARCGFLRRPGHPGSQSHP